MGRRSSEPPVPAAVQRMLANLEMEVGELRDYLRVQRAAYDQIQSKSIDFEGWVAFKLSASRADSRIALRWMEENHGKKK
jgi:hypothetical protein